MHKIQRAEYHCKLLYLVFFLSELLSSHWDASAYELPSYLSQAYAHQYLQATGSTDLKKNLCVHYSPRLRQTALISVCMKNS